MQHKYRVAISVALASARERGAPIYVVRDCIDGELYAVSNDSRKDGYLTAEVYACVRPDGLLILNDYYVETYQLQSTKNPMILRAGALSTARWRGTGCGA
jgi:hypothetical protein